LAGSSSNAWLVRFFDGYTGDSDVSTTNFVRCVR
jgi:hypothetical protein